MFKQKNYEFDLIAIDVQHVFYDVEKILNFKINKRMNDSIITRKKYFNY